MQPAKAWNSMQPQRIKPMQPLRAEGEEEPAAGAETVVEETTEEAPPKEMIDIRLTMNMFGSTADNKFRHPPKLENSKVFDVRTVTKVTKGGKRMSFRAAVVVGDAQGKVAVAMASAAEVSTAVQQAENQALKKTMIARITDDERATIPIPTQGKMGAALVILRP